MRTIQLKSLNSAFWTLILVFASFISSCQTTQVANSNFTTVKIGPRIWTVRNLDVASFRNGDPIMEAKTAEEWEKAANDGKPAWCYYENDTANGTRYGKLYNYFAITDPRGLAPAGWHLPSNEDWRTITGSQGGVDITGMKLKSANGWQKKDYANNKAGFTALPAGTRSIKGKFSDINYLGQWWSTSIVPGTPQVYSFMVKDPSIEVFYLKVDKGLGLSVRLVKD
jgi:uncharacterized protein (TIGR02145 family)